MCHCHPYSPTFWESHCQQLILANYVAYLVQTALEWQCLEYSSGLNSETQETEAPAEYIECDWWVVTNGSHAEEEEPVLKGELKELWKLPTEEQKRP